MFKYLVILDNNHGQWVQSTSQLSPTYVFEAPNDVWASGFIKKFLEGSRKLELRSLHRITQGIALQEIQTSGSEESFPKDTEITHRLEERIGFERFSHFDSVRQLQPFSARERKERLLNILKAQTQEVEDKERLKKIPIPKIGDNIYVSTSLYVYRGRDDFIGGLAEVIDVATLGPYNHTVWVKERPGASYSWEQLALQQEELKEEFGEERAHPEPDLRPEFNED